MANLTIKNLPDAMYRQLKKYARMQGRSLNAQVIHTTALYVGFRRSETCATTGWPKSWAGPRGKARSRDRERGTQECVRHVKLWGVPELPDIVVYIEALEKRILGQTLEHVRLASPFLLRSVDPPVSRVEGKTVRELRRIGKRIAIGLDDELWLVLHLMIAGRLHWRPRGAKVSRPRGLAAFDFPNGSLVLTEAGSKRRASLHVVSGEAGLGALDPGGLEVLEADLEEFTKVLTSSNHTLKRALTDPRSFSGIGNAYSDEILFEAQLSPVALTQKLKAEQIARLYEAIRRSLNQWAEKLRREASDDFPEKVTAFREGMAVHGRYHEPCPRCGAKIQRIRYADNETNYCANCQTGGKLLADRALSRLLREDWPRTLDELELLTIKKC